MGCWNHTCAVTNLPVYCNEQVVVLMLKEATKKYKTSSCSPNKYYTPLPLTFQGKYDEYGAVEDCCGSALPTIVDGIRNHLVEFDLGENEYHDIEVRRTDFDINLLFQADSEDRLCVKVDPRYGEERMLSHVVVKQEVYEGIIKNSYFEKWDEKKEETVKIKYKDLKKMYPQYLHDLYNSSEIDRKYFGERPIGKNLVGRLLSASGSEESDMKSPIRVQNILLKMFADKEDEDKIVDIIDNGVQLCLFHKFMCSGRMSYHLPSGLGSQDDSTEAQQLRAKLTIKSALKLAKMWDV